MSFQLLQFLSQNGFSLCSLQKRSEPRFRIQVERRTNHPRPRTYARTAWGMKWQMRALTHAPPRTLQSLVIPLAVSSLVLGLHSDKVSLFVPAFFRFVLGFKNTLIFYDESVDVIHYYYILFSLRPQSIFLVCKVV